jgi:hypothetical protein
MPSPARPAGVSTGFRIAAVVMTAVPSLCGVAALAAPPPRPAAAPILVPRVAAFAPSTSLFESTLRRRLENEARRQGVGLDMPFIAGPGDDVESLEPGSGRRVGRAILRALRGTLDERLEEAARGSATFAPLFRWIDGRDGGAPGLSSGAPAVTRLESAAPFRAGAPPEPAQRGLGDVALRFRLDAHPRLLLGARLGALSGRIEVPVLERELRLSLDRPIGGHGRASFRGGRSAERGEWADLALQFRF